jgi:hypothetical protein
MKYQAEFETTLVSLPAHKLDGYYCALASLIKNSIQKEKKQNELLAGSGNCGAGRDAGGDVGALAALESTATENETGQNCELSDGRFGISDTPDGAVSDHEDD